jgi:hypothetical protein
MLDEMIQHRCPIHPVKEPGLASQLGAEQCQRLLEEHVIPQI